MIADIARFLSNSNWAAVVKLGASAQRNRDTENVLRQVLLLGIGSPL